jgi:hypothetical protein
LYVTRKEYLQKLRTKLLLAKEYNEKSLLETSGFRTKELQEADKNRIVAANSTTEQGKRWVKEKFLPEYKTDEQIAEDNVIRSNADFDQQIAIVDQNLKMPEDELRQDAIISSLWDFKGFVDESEQFKTYLVKENPAYYNKKLIRSVPQLFGIEFRMAIENPTMAQAYTDILKAMDFRVLKNMLGK